MAMTNPEVWLGDDGIMRVDYSRCQGITLATYKSSYEQRLKISRDRLPVLLVGKRVGFVDHQALRFASSDEVCAITAALGMLAGSFLEKHLGQMFIAYHTPPYPTRMFDSETEALGWLKTFLKSPGSE